MSESLRSHLRPFDVYRGDHAAVVVQDSTSYNASSFEEALT